MQVNLLLEASPPASPLVIEQLETPLAKGRAEEVAGLQSLTLVRVPAPRHHLTLISQGRCLVPCPAGVRETGQGRNTRRGNSKVWSSSASLEQPCQVAPGSYCVVLTNGSLHVANARKERRGMSSQTMSRRCGTYRTWYILCSTMPAGTEYIISNPLP